MANERLKQAMTSAGLDVEQLAHAVGVDAKTVERWLAGRTPHTRTRTRVARALSVSERELWPLAHIPEPDAPGTVELVTAFPHTADATPTWPSLLQDATERIWLLDFTLLDFLAADGIPALLATKANHGVEVRLLISYATRARLATDTPIDEPYPDPEPDAAYEIARARGHIQTLIDHDGVQARKFIAMRFNTIICADEQMLITHHLWANPATKPPRSIYDGPTSPRCSPNMSSTTTTSGSTRLTPSSQSRICFHRPSSTPPIIRRSRSTTRPPAHDHRL